MNFFEQQDRAYRNSKQLIVLLCLAVISLIAITTLLVAIFFALSNGKQQSGDLWLNVRHALNWKLLLYISLGVGTVILLGSLYKLIQLSSGGRAIAEAMDARLLDPLNANADERKLLNVIEEMAIASGTPVPPAYLIEDDAINAFAAGYSPQDAIIGVTRGCIQQLTRDQLQGVIAHEFSHIFHGDMRLNMRLLALLNGILLVGLIGEFLLRSGSHRPSSSRNKSGGGLLALGVGLLIIGYAGTFFGKLIKSAVSRQREFLADASAVKFTRNPDGIGGALKQLGSYSSGSQLQTARAAEFSHMFFGEAVTAGFFQRAMATHPPLTERILRIDPHWDGQYPTYTYIEEASDSAPGNEQIENSYIKEEGLVAAFAHPQTPVDFAVAVDQALEVIGQPDAAHLAYAQHTLKSIPAATRQAAHQPWDAQALILGLLLAKDKPTQSIQWQCLATVFTAAQVASLQNHAQAAALLSDGLRLPLIEISLPALKNLSAEQYRQFKKAMAGFIRADNEVSLMEWSLFHIVTHNLETRTIQGPLRNLEQLREDTCVLLSAIANTGAEVTAHDIHNQKLINKAEAAFAAGRDLLGFADARLLLPSEYGLEDLQHSLNALAHLKPLQKPKLLKAICLCVLADQQVTIAEAELFRAIADALDCPVPPMIKAASA